MLVFLLYSFEILTCTEIMHETLGVAILSENRIGIPYYMDEISGLGCAFNRKIGTLCNFKRDFCLRVEEFTEISIPEEICGLWVEKSHRNEQIHTLRAAWVEKSCRNEHSKHIWTTCQNRGEWENLVPPDSADWDSIWREAPRKNRGFTLVFPI